MSRLRRRTGTYQDGPIRHQLCPSPNHTPTYLERQPRLHLVCQHLRDTPVEVREDLHRKLRLDTALANQIVQRIRERHANAVTFRSVLVAR